MSAFGFTGIYIALHFSLYSMILRHRRVFNCESSIFFYHLGSFLVLLSTLAAFSNSLVLLVGCLSLHGIYSLSFLELWSLAEGGYSLNILRRMQNGISAEESCSWLESLGSAKKKQRIDSLVHLKMIARADGNIRLTRVGRIVAAGLGSLAAVTGNGLAR